MFNKNETPVTTEDHEALDGEVVDDETTEKKDRKSAFKKYAITAGLGLAGTLLVTVLFGAFLGGDTDNDDDDDDTDPVVIDANDPEASGYTAISDEGSDENE